MPCVTVQLRRSKNEERRTKNGSEGPSNASPKLYLSAGGSALGRFRTIQSLKRSPRSKGNVRQPKAKAAHVRCTYRKH